MRCSVVLFAVLMLLAQRDATSHPINEEEQPIFIQIFNQKHRPPQSVAESETGLSRDGLMMETKWITQKLDNFDKNNNETWQMRYMVDDTVFQSGGPIIIYLGGEWDIDPKSPYDLILWEFVQQYGGIYFYTEHRFYGESRPKDDLRVEYLEKYFNVEQALADVAYFVRTIKQTIEGAQNSKVILAGGSYSATMAAWFAKSYPELTDGAWASSAPLFVKTDFSEYKEIMGQSILAKSGQECYDRVKNAFEQIQNMFKEGRGAEVKSMMNLCNNFNENDDMDRWNFFYLFSDEFAGVIQYATSNSIQNLCESFTNDEEDYINYAKYFLKKFQKSNTCIDMTYQTTLQNLLSIEYNGAMRQWTFQTCNEIGWFQTSDSTEQPFGSEYPLDYFVNMCNDLFGDKYTSEYTTRRGKEYNNKFGGLNPGLDNVHYTQGSLDPWKGVGIQTNVIEGGSHCQDMRKASQEDSPQMSAAHTILRQIVKDWVNA